MKTEKIIEGLEKNDITGFLEKIHVRFVLRSGSFTEECVRVFDLRVCSGKKNIPLKNLKKENILMLLKSKFSKNISEIEKNMAKNIEKESGSNLVMDSSKK